MDYPVGIIGAGPAGAAAALRLSSLGIPCLLMDKAVFPREKVCGGAISGKVTTLLQRLDPRILERFRALPQQNGVWGIRLVAPGGTPIDIRFPAGRELPAGCPPGFVCPRVIFDDFLLQEVRRRPGIRLMTGLEIREPRYLPGCGWHLREPDLKVGLLFDAGGASSAFSRAQAGLRRHPRHYAVSVRAYCRDLPPFPPHALLELHFLRDLLPGYLWVFPLPDGRANAGIGIRADIRKKRGLKLPKAFAERLASHPRLRAAQLESSVQGYGLPLGSRRLPVSGPHYMLLGDAAQLIDPLTGEGIGNAVYSGFLAAEQAAECFRLQRFDAAFMKAYDQRIARVLGAEMELSARLQRAGRYPGLLNAVASILHHHPEAIRQLSAMYTDLNLRKTLASPAFWIKKALETAIFRKK